MNKGAWIHSPNGNAYKELTELVSLIRIAKMSDEQYNPSTPPYYDGEAMLAKSAMSLGDLRTPTACSVLQARKDELLKQIKAIDDAITALDENPGVEKVLNILRKVGI